MFKFTDSIQHKSNTVEWILGDCLESLKKLPDNCIQCCVTSPPYFNLRDYDNNKQIGKEVDPKLYVKSLTSVFREIKRVLKEEGSCFLNLGDSYWPGGNNTSNLKAKDLVGIPWEVAFSLRNDGWYLRQDIIWQKLNPMPESVKSRCTRAHEYVFLLTKNDKYYFDHKAIAVPADPSSWGIPKDGIYKGKDKKDYNKAGVQQPSAIKKRLAAKLASGEPITRNEHSVWTINKPSYGGNHFAVMPTELATRCILAGSKKGDWILDPFSGAGTTALAAVINERNCLLLELNEDYILHSKERLVTAFTKPLAKPILPPVDDLFTFGVNIEEIKDDNNDEQA